MFDPVRVGHFHWVFRGIDSKTHCLFLICWPFIVSIVGIIVGDIQQSHLSNICSYSKTENTFVLVDWWRTAHTGILCATINIVLFTLKAVVRGTFKTPLNCFISGKSAKMVDDCFLCVCRRGCLDVWVQTRRHARHMLMVLRGLDWLGPADYKLLFTVSSPLTIPTYFKLCDLSVRIILSNIPANYFNRTDWPHWFSIFNHNI